MKLNGISDKGLRRVAANSKQGDLYDEDYGMAAVNDIHNVVYDCIDLLRGVGDEYLTPYGANLLDKAYQALFEFYQNTDKVIK